MALQSLPFTFSSQIMPRIFMASQAMSSVGGRWSHIWQTSTQTTPNIPATLLKPAALSLNIPGFLSDIWDSVLRAVPKKKTSHMKKRHRQMAGKALKDVKSLNTCPGCGQIKRAHVLCPHCVETGNAGSTDIWAIALSDDGQYLAGVSQDGHIRVWDLDANGEQIRDYETKGSFGTCIDLSVDGRLIASGHENGSVYIFSTETGRMPFSLSGLVKPVRAVAFSPGGKFLAAAGDSNDIQHGFYRFLGATRENIS
ncbi:hypothetical protein ABOM_006915 [Aspergillus bombycis]|uniref:Uncharacterized protein n=1 Tax=Aspergillus bombycis TaxID=109264 RepID=A0A1F7ZWD7_9EURO|nr:hypothetical protein ABOM_006915 [Aspergillus bombycis]OGM43783.1 hypothetical protein ABOM_006915 [Aspergillus bombycis]